MSARQPALRRCLAAAWLALACSRERAPAEESTRARPATRLTASAEAAPEQSPRPLADSPSPAADSTEAPPPASARPGRPSPFTTTGGRAAGDGPRGDAGPPAEPSPFVVDEPAEIGPSGPATATPFGVLMNDRAGSLYIARLGPLARTATPVPTRIGEVPEGSGPFGLGRGPGVFQEHAYWISQGSLVRRRVSARANPGPLEVLARDAFDGTRVGTPIAPLGRVPRLPPIPATVAYVVRPDKEGAPLSARLWTEGAPAETLTPEGSSTHSVSLVRTAGGVLSIAVQARMAMTPVHARPIRFVSGRPQLGDDVVAWVGGGVQPLTEMTLLPLGETALYGYLPHERSTQEFGIARLDLGVKPDMDTPTAWLLYQNGIDPAPVAAGELCGEPVLVDAEPRARAPGSGQELVVRSAALAPAARFPVGAARAFYFVSYASLPGGGLVAWVADDGVTRAATLRCQMRRK